MPNLTSLIPLFGHHIRKKDKLFFTYIIKNIVSYFIVIYTNSRKYKNSVLLTVDMKKTVDLISLTFYVPIIWSH